MAFQTTAMYAVTRTPPLSRDVDADAETFVSLPQVSPEDAVSVALTRALRAEVLTVVALQEGCVRLGEEASKILHSGRPIEVTMSGVTMRLRRLFVSETVSPVVPQ